MRALALVLLAGLSLQASHVASLGSRNDKLIGWSENYKADINRKNVDKTTTTEVDVLTWEPRIFHLKHVLTDEECDHMIAKAKPRLTRSGVVAENNGGESVSDIRTSQGMFFNRYEDSVLKTVEHRMSEYTMIPPGNGEGIQVLRYGDGQEYKPHFDYFFHAQGEDNGGNRIATVLMYLSEPELGGETVFPNVPRPESQTREAGFSECADAGLAVRPRKGDAVVFWSLRTDGTLDKGSLHGSCPVLKGVKWAATKWYHVAHYALGGEQEIRVHHQIFKPSPPPAPPGCKDDHASCRGWADGGECENNPHFMIGDPDSPGTCLLSCGRCDLMKPASS